MSRWLLLGGLAVAIWLSIEVLVSRLRSRLRGEPALPALRILGRLLFGGGKRAAAAPGTPAAIHLVRCAACGQHVPENRSYRGAPAGSEPPTWFCSPDCQRSAGAAAR